MEKELGKELKAQTEKMLKDLEKETESIRIAGSADKKATKEALENLKAYISDCRHFREKGDLIRAYEAAVFAWGIYETLLWTGLVVKKQ